MTHSLPMRSRLDELEWLICNEPDSAIRAANVKEYHEVYEAIHGYGPNHGSGEARVRAVRPDH